MGRAAFTPARGTCYPVSPRGPAIIMGDDFSTLVPATLAGNAESARSLIQSLYPVVANRVARVLGRDRRTGSRSARQEVDDMVQEVFAGLFERQGHVLRAWDPVKGLSLPNFVGLFAERTVLSILRSGRRSPWPDDPSTAELLEAASAEVPPVEPDAVSRDLLAALLDRLRLALSPMGLQMFELLFVQEREVDEVVSALKMSSEAVYAWRSRLRKIASDLLTELAAEGDEPRRARGLS